MLKLEKILPSWLILILRKLIFKYWHWRSPKYRTIKGIKIPIGKHISTDILEYIYLGSYETYELHLVELNLCQDDVVMEIGAGIGLISSYCAHKIGSNRVFAYEANPELESPIYNTYSLNNISPHLEISLIGNQEGKQTFYIEPSFWRSSTRPTTHQAKAIDIPVKSFNKEIKKINPSFLIIDIEGGEYELLKYADFYNVRKIMIELHPNLLNSEQIDFVKSKLNQAGFKINRKLSGNEELFLEKQ